MDEAACASARAHETLLAVMAGAEAERPCPDVASLAGFFEDRLLAEDRADVAAHMERCRSCLDALRLMALAMCDEFVRSFSPARRSSGAPVAPGPAASRDSPDDLEERLAAFARTRLGPASERQVRQPQVLHELAAQVRAGRSLADTVLAHIHARLPWWPALLDEFVTYFHADLLRARQDTLSSASQLQRYVDPEDAVRAVLAKLVVAGGDLPFESVSQFKRLFLRRVGAMAAAELRGGAKRPTGRAGELGLASAAAPGETSPAAARRTGENERLSEILLRLPARDWQTLALQLRGMPLPQGAQQLRLSLHETQHLLAAAKARARRLDGSLRDADAGRP